MTRYALYAAGFLIFALVFFALAYLAGAVIGLAFFALAGLALVAALVYGSWKLARLKGPREPPTPRT